MPSEYNIIHSVRLRGTAIYNKKWIAKKAAELGIVPKKPQKPVWKPRRNAKPIVVKLDPEVKIQRRFWEKVELLGADDCWPWKGSLMNYKRKGQDYGLTTYYGKIQFVHRLAYIFEVGPIPEGLEVMHTCDNPRCVNPAHLRAATHLENMQDAARKGRMHNGRSAPLPIN